MNTVALLQQSSYHTQHPSGALVYSSMRSAPCSLLPWLSSPTTATGLPRRPRGLLLALTLAAPLFPRALVAFFCLCLRSKAAALRTSNSLRWKKFVPPRTVRTSSRLASLAEASVALTGPFRISLIGSPGIILPV